MSQKRRSQATTTAQKSANHHNAQKSTGPITIEGKAQLATHALKHGLTSKNFTLLPWEDPEEYRKMYNEIWSQLKPRGGQQKALAIRIIHNNWRLHRIFVYESIAAHDLFEEKGLPITSLDGTPAMIYVDRVIHRLRRYDAAIRKSLAADEKHMAYLKNIQTYLVADNADETPQKSQNESHLPYEPFEDSSDHPTIYAPAALFMTPPTSQQPTVSVAPPSTLQDPTHRPVFNQQGTTQNPLDTGNTRGNGFVSQSQNIAPLQAFFNAVLQELGDQFSVTMPLSSSLPTL